MKNLVTTLAGGCILIGTVKLYGLYEYARGVHDASKYNRIIKDSVNDFAAELKEVLLKDER